MSSVNKVILLGNLGKDPELRYMPSGDAVATFSVATTERFTDKSGEKREETEWHRVIFWGKIAEVCQQYLTKGSQVYIEGKIKTNKYKDKEGVERYSTEIRGEVMKMIGGKKSEGGVAQQKSAPAKAGTFDDMDDDLPF